MSDTGGVDGTATGIGGALVSHRDAFMGFLMKRLGNRADAEDVLQDFCLRALARSDQLRDAGRLDAWLYAVLRSALNDHHRKNGRRERLGEAFAHDPLTPEVEPDSYEAMAQICACIEHLVPELRPQDGDLVRRLDLGGEDRGAVAADLGIKQGALAVRLHRARAALRDRLVGHCGCCCEHGFEDCHCPMPHV